MPLDSYVAMLSALPGSAAPVALAAAVGAGLAGALTPTVAYRWSVPWGEPLRGACSACSATLPTGLSGWLRLGRPCRTCRAGQAPSTWWTVPVGAISAGLLGLAYADQPWLLPAALLLSVLGVLLAAVDLAVFRLPDPIMAVAVVGMLLGLAVAALGTGDWASFGRALAGGVALLLAYGMLAFVAGGGIGLGDVKLAGVLGLLLGWTGWAAVLLGGALAALLNGVVAAVLLIMRRVGWRDSVPMGPSLLVGALIAIVWTSLR